MTQADLVSKVAEKVGISKSAAQSAVKAVFESVSETLDDHPVRRARRAQRADRGNP